MTVIGFSVCSNLFCVCCDMFSIASRHCLPDDVVAMVLLFGATLDCTPSCYSNLFVEFL